MTADNEALRRAPQDAYKYDTLTLEHELGLARRKLKAEIKRRGTDWKIEIAERSLVDHVRWLEEILNQRRLQCRTSSFSRGLTS